MSRKKASKVFLVTDSGMRGSQTPDCFIIGRHPKGALAAARAKGREITSDTKAHEVDESYRSQALNLGKGA